MRIKVQILTVAVTGLVSSLALMETSASASPGASGRMCEVRCSGSAVCLRECENELVMRRVRRGRIVVIRIPRDEPEVAKSWIDGVFNPATGGGAGGGGGGGGGNGR